MKTRSILITVVFCLVALAMSFADDPNVGTWKLNESKSKIPAGVVKNTTVVYTADGDNMKVTTEGTTGDGQPAHTEWTGKFDGKDYPLTGDPTADSRSYTKVDDRTLSLANKKDGKASMTGKIVVSPDGKSRTVTVSGKDAKGKKLSSTAIYDKQ
jgi:hypothetical protein